MIEYKLNLAGCECAVAEWNPSGSILVFALHGWLDNLASFESLVEFMPALHIVAIDFPGHGHSAHINAGSAYHFVDGLFLIDDLAAHFKLNKIKLLGHSMGGAVSSLYAASQPTKVEALVLIESLGPLTAEPQESIVLMHKAVKQRALLAGKRKPVYANFELALKARAEASMINADLIKPLVERALTNIDSGYTWCADPRLRVSSALRMSEQQLSHALISIEAPVLLIEGDRGFIAENDSLQARKKLIAQLNVCQFKGGHHVHLEEPKACAVEIQAFFKAIGENNAS